MSPDESVRAVCEEILTLTDIVMPSDYRAIVTEVLTAFRAAIQAEWDLETRPNKDYYNLGRAEQTREFDARFANTLKEFGTIERLVDAYREAKMEVRNAYEHGAHAAAGIMPPPHALDEIKREAYKQGRREGLTEAAQAARNYGVVQQVIAEEKAQDVPGSSELHGLEAIMAHRVALKIEALRDSGPKEEA